MERQMEGIDGVVQSMNKFDLVAELSNADHASGIQKSRV